MVYVLFLEVFVLSLFIVKFKGIVKFFLLGLGGKSFFDFNL